MSDSSKAVLKARFRCISVTVIGLKSILLRNVVIGGDIGRPVKDVMGATL